MRKESSIVDKIKKLLALSKSSNQAEAEAALNKANELLVRHNLEREDVEENFRPKIERHVYLSGRDAKSCRMLLLSALCRLNFSALLVVKTPTSGFYRFEIIGERHNAISTAHMADYLFKAVERISREHVPKQARKQYREDFRLGMVTNICRRIEVMAERNQTDAKARALVLVEQRGIEEFLSIPGISSFKLRGPSKMNAYQNGYGAGGKVSLNNQVTAG